jgi:hypothetical protein
LSLAERFLGQAGRAWMVVRVGWSRAGTPWSGACAPSWHPGSGRVLGLVLEAGARRAPCRND